MEHGKEGQVDLKKTFAASLASEPRLQELPYKGADDNQSSRAPSESDRGDERPEDCTLRDVITPRLGCLAGCRQRSANVLGQERHQRIDHAESGGVPFRLLFEGRLFDVAHLPLCNVEVLLKVDDASQETPEDVCICVGGIDQPPMFRAARRSAMWLWHPYTCLLEVPVSVSCFS
jgi:hypothetical protein